MPTANCQLLKLWVETGFQDVKKLGREGGFEPPSPGWSPGALPKLCYPRVPLKVQFWRTRVSAPHVPQKGQAGAAAQAFKLMDGAGPVNRAQGVPEVPFLHFRIRKICILGIRFEQHYSLTNLNASSSGRDFIDPPAL